MKHKLLILLLLVTMLFPYKVDAKVEKERFKSLNLDEALTAEKIEHDFSNYKETEDQITIYVFRGQGCDFCKNLLTFLNSIVPEYGKYFKVVSYEVWENVENRELLNSVGETLGVTIEGVPFVVIGNQYFPGYADVYDEEIKKAIKAQYEKEAKYDVIEAAIENLNNKENPESKSNTSSTEVIIWTFVFTTFWSLVILIVNYRQNKNMKEQLALITEKLNKKSK